ncbi:MAG: START-like domain-containing protein [Crocinitomicaceae bacterium]|jgi:hypothetical protein|nr:START-like domain-containing protein [Crocinitomicaceae bacterium]MDG1659645.1 START-like domain-containing protein [Crocinitomicaceae bacterium]MDG2441329.1 START-like domain-containing protein [Crocinitomicaceae bacterium]|tara:strand:+ start:815 stop:1204 length:390 start_codon:yes stop_codon:yes gene_type:complete
MAEMEKYEMEFLLRTSLKSLDTMISTPSGLSEWFADDVNIKDDVYSFFWDGSSEDARLLSKKANARVKWRWIEAEEDGEDTFFEFRYEVDPMTKSVILLVTDFAEDDELDESQRLWEKQIGTLKQKLGA